MRQKEMCKNDASALCSHNADYTAYTQEFIYSYYTTDSIY